MQETADPSLWKDLAFPMDSGRAPQGGFVWLLMSQWPALEGWSGRSLLFWSHQIEACARQGHLVATGCFSKRAASASREGERRAACSGLSPPSRALLAGLCAAGLGCPAALAPPGVQLLG